VSSRSHILLVDEDESGQALCAVLRDDGHRVEFTRDGETAHQALETQELDLLIADMVAPAVNGFGLLRTARAVRPTMPVILVSEYGTVETAVQALKQGAYHYFGKPLDFDAVRATVTEALHPAAPRTPYSPPLLTRAEREHFGIVGQGPWFDEALNVMRRVAPTRATVLLTGASGTGKELFARAVHRMSGRKGPFVAVSCAALSRDLLESELFGHEKGSFTGADRRKVGRFELAHGGTLFLDEIGEVPLDLQVKLLRVLQERQFERVGGTETLDTDVRIVAATNRDLVSAIEQRTFREDLYYRLKVIELLLPPLRDRVQDVEPLAEHFIRHYAVVNSRPVLAIGPEARTILHHYAWPGNVRELENVMERAVVLAEPWDTVLHPSLLPAQVREGVEAAGPAPVPPLLTAQGTTQESWLEFLEETLQRCDGNATEAAKLLGTSARAVRYHADRAGLPRRKHGRETPPGARTASGMDLATVST
jgi:two-component system, NtrC family, response regulator HydG